MSPYFDHMASTPLDPRVLDAMQPYFLQANLACNHAANHRAGEACRQVIEHAKETILTSLQAQNHYELIFTSGATESINLCLSGLAHTYRKQKNHLISFATEHAATLMCLENLAKDGFEITILPVQPSGHIDYDLLSQHIKPTTLMISAVHVNNEIGVTHNPDQLSALASKHGVLLHLDCAQTIGKAALDLQTATPDFVSLSAHKVYGPKGIGALLRRKQHKRKLTPLLFGQTLYNPYRPGTLPTPLIVGMQSAYALAQDEFTDRIDYVRTLHELFVTHLPDSVTWHGDRKSRVPHNINVSLPLSASTDDIRELCDTFTLSQASSCSNHTSSHVLRAIGVEQASMQRALRISLSHTTRQSDCEQLIQTILQSV